MKVRIKRKPLKASLCRPLLITLLLIWSFCIAPVAQADTVILTNPTNLVAISISNSQISLTWTDNSSNEIGYTLERRTGSGSYSVLANLVANTTNYTDSGGLTSGTTYTYRIMALGNGNNISSSGYSTEASATTYGSTSSGALTAPANLAATMASASQVNLTWTDYASGESGYIVERAVGSGSFSVLGYLSPNSQSFPDTTVVNNTTYTYRVQALGSSSNTTNSAYSNLATITVGSTGSGSSYAPTNLSASAVSQYQINLVWTDNSSSESGYIVERAIGTSGTFQIVAYCLANSQAYSDINLTANTTYRYRVQALGGSAGNSSYSNEASATTGVTSSGALSTPTNLYANSISQTQINLTWTDNATNETAYIVERAVGSGSFQILAYLNPNLQAYSDSNLTANVTYRYRVQAYNNTMGTSSYSNEASATAGNITSGSLATPTGLTATVVTSSQVNLVWTDNASSEIGYNVERAAGNTGTFTLLSYLGPNAQSFSDTGLVSNTTYIYRVQARGSSSNSAYSNEASVNLGNLASGSLTPPAYITATPVSGSQINLVWTDNSTGESGYNLERKSADGSYSIIAYLAADVQSYSDTGLQEGTTYTYRIQARGNGSTIPDSTYSIEASATTTGQTSKTTVLRFYIGRMYYYLNDEGQFMDAAPVLQSNRTMLPITYAALPLGVEVDWKQSEKKVTLTRAGKVIELWIDKNTAMVNGEKQNIDTNTKVVPTVINGRTMLPLAFVATALDCDVQWDAATQEVKITYPKP